MKGSTFWILPGVWVDVSGEQDALSILNRRTPEPKTPKPQALNTLYANKTLKKASESPTTTAAQTSQDTQPL